MIGDEIVQVPRVDGARIVRERASVGPPPGLRGYDAKQVSVDTDLVTGDQTRVQQSFGTEVDINTIVRRYGVNVSNLGSEPVGMYGDFTGITDYESAVERIAQANDRFMKLPASVRERFNNNPAELIRAADALHEKEFGSMFVEESAPVAPVVDNPPVSS